jgi:hypothetical protein
MVKIMVKIMIKIMVMVFGFKCTPDPLGTDAGLHPGLNG